MTYQWPSPWMVHYYSGEVSCASSLVTAAKKKKFKKNEETNLEEYSEYFVLQGMIDKGSHLHLWYSTKIFGVLVA